MSAPAKTAAPARPADPFQSALAERNPFGHHRVTATGAQPPDVPTIHEYEFRQLVALARRAHDQNEAVGAVVWGESGSGKSNLLRRLGEWAANDHAVLVQFLELQAAPHRLHRAVLNATVGALTNGFARPWHDTPLYQLLEGLIRPAVGGGKKSLSPAELKAAFDKAVAGPVALAGGVPAARAAASWLHLFVLGALSEKRKGATETATAALRRLSGDELDADEAKVLGLRATEATQPLDPADCAAVLALLAQLVRAAGKPLVICCDQINTLPRAQISEVSRFLHDLNDRLRNTLLVLSEVREELLQNLEGGVIAQATWDRLSANKVDVQRLTVAEGRRILEARLEAFFTPFEGEQALKRHYTEDPLFPLGDGWFRERFGKLVDVRPRHMIDAARERWEQVQAALAGAPDPRKWLDSWPDFKPVTPPPVKPETELIDAEVEKAVSGRVARHLATPGALPPNADNLCALAESLLAGGGVGLAVERAIAGGAYHLVVRAPNADGTGETTTGLLFVTTGNATGVTNALRRLAEDAKRPARVLLVTDARAPLALGKQPTAQGRKYYTTLTAAPWFAHLELPTEQYAALEALDTVARQAGDVEIGSPPRPLKRDEVLASYRRTKRFEAHPLLGRFAAPGPITPKPVSDAEVREFVLARLALTMGTDTHELAQQFLNALPADRRAGLDAAACRARVEAVARPLAAAGDIGMTKLPDGFFLLPLRRPAAR